MPRPYYPLALWNYTPVLRAMPALPIENVNDAPTVCVQMSVTLVPYLIGLLEIYRWPDKFFGTDNEVKKSLGIIQDLIVALTEGNCPDCPEASMTIFRFTEECGLEYSNSNGEMWTPVDGWSTFAESCFKGADGRSPEFQLVPFDALCQTIQWRLVGDLAWMDLGQVCNGADGQDGAQGPQGIQGEPGAQGPQGIQGEPGDCDCSTNPPINPNPPSDGLNCSIAINLTKELRRIWNAGYTDSNGFVSQYSGGLISAAGLIALVIPGVNALAAGAAVIAGALVQLAQLEQQGEANAFDDAAEERYRCMLYCILDQDGTVNEAVLDEWQTAIRGDELNPFAYIAADLVDSVPADHWQWFAYASSEVNPAACDCTCNTDRLISFQVASSTAEETAIQPGHVVKVLLTSPAGDALPSDVVVNFHDIPGAAGTPSDYLVLTPGQVTFPAGSVNGDTQDIEINIYEDAADSGETFQLQLDSVTGPATIDAASNMHEVTIQENNPCAPQYNTWTAIGATPSGWSAPGSIPASETATWIGVSASGLETDTSPPLVPYNASRSANTNWTNSAARIGIRYDFTEPCEVTELHFRVTYPNTNTKRGGIVVKLAASQVWEVLANTLDPTPAPSQMQYSWTGTARLIDAVMFLTADGGTTGTRSITITNINIPV